MATVVRAVALEPFSMRARRELLWCVIGLLTGAAGLAVVTVAVQPNTAVAVVRGGVLLALLGLVLVAIGAARSIAGWYRRLAARLLGVQVEASPPLRVGGGIVRRTVARIGDARTWRAALYLLLKVPSTLVHGYALLWWVGLVNLTYPFWWGLFRNHDPGVRLSPVPAITPFGIPKIATFPGTLVVFAAGAGMVLVAPWVTRLVTAADRRLLVALLGPGRLARRVSHLEASRDLVADDAAVTSRRIERDLHDGPQAQLATLAMKLGQAKERLEHDATVAFDPVAAHTLVADAHLHAKAALAELRNIARGVHPPALDVGLDEALATLVARSPVPADLRVATGPRPTLAIQTIAYFSVAELLANVATHSGAGGATVEIVGRDGWLRVAVTDDGVGGARVGGGSGLSGLADRVRAVDGRIDVASPPGGPTVVVVELPVNP